MIWDSFTKKEGCKVVREIVAVMGPEIIFLFIVRFGARQLRLSVPLR